MFTTRSFSFGLCAAVAVATLSSPASAKQIDLDWDFCLDDVAMDALLGSWEADLGKGYVISSGVVLPHPGSKRTEVGVIANYDGNYTLTPQGGGVILDIERANAKDWREFDKPSLPAGATIVPGAGKPKLPYDPAEIERKAHCPASDLPRYIGTGAAVIDGMTMNFTYRLVMVGPNELSGHQEVSGTADGHAYVERRSVHMTKLE